jgi:hypothetical protein
LKENAKLLNRLEQATWRMVIKPQKIQLTHQGKIQNAFEHKSLRGMQTYLCAAIAEDDV